jgi:hypothetical protein
MTAVRPTAVNSREEISRSGNKGETVAECNARTCRLMAEPRES